jgi:hypothetical protein
MSVIDFHRTSVNDESFIRGAARLLIAAITQTFPATLGAIVNLSLYDPIAGWTDIGATKTGVQISVNNAEENFDVDQILTDISTLPTGWDVQVGTQLAEATLDKLSLAWEGDVVTTATEDGVANVKTTGVGNPDSYTYRRLAVLFRRPSNLKIRGYIFRKVSRMPQESTITHAKTGEQISIPVRFRAFADTSITTVKSRIFVIKDQT